jgi:GTPase SAR1 family protein
VAPYHLFNQLPGIHQLRQIPIILVGNKMDKREDMEDGRNQQTFTNVKDILKRVFKKYRNV